VLDAEDNQPSVLYTETLWDGTASLVQRLATGCKVWGSNPDGGEIFRTSPEGTWEPPSLLYKIPSVKRPGHGFNYPTFLAPRLKKGYSHTILPSWQAIG